jgi:hypothetical protein
MSPAQLNARKCLRVPAGCEGHLTRRQAAAMLGFASEFKIREFERQGLLRSVRGPMRTAFYPRPEILALKARLAQSEPYRASLEDWSDADLIALLEHPTRTGLPRSILDLVMETRISIERAERVHAFWAGASRVGSPPALPAAYRRGRAWEPSQGSHVQEPAPRASIRMAPAQQRPRTEAAPETEAGRERRGESRLAHDGLLGKLRDPDPRVRQQAFERLRESRTLPG